MQFSIPKCFVGEINELQYLIEQKNCNSVNIRQDHNPPNVVNSYLKKRICLGGGGGGGEGLRGRE